MKVPRALLAILFFGSLFVVVAAANDNSSDHPQPAKKVYGEWRILVKPDKGHEYNALITSRGLPLFRQAGGRMVGWWNTLIGNLYEQVTIWEYDDMAAFERAIGILGKEKGFDEFVTRRDPLLDGEQNRFLTLVDGAEQPVLSDPSKFVVHEIHRVPQIKLPHYLDFMTQQGLKLLKSHGFRPVGPWTVEVGKWSEVTYLFRFDSLNERNRLIREFSVHADAKIYGTAIANSGAEIITRVLMPASFAGVGEAKAPRRLISPPIITATIFSAPTASTTAVATTAIASAPAASSLVASKLLPHLEQLAKGVVAAGFADRFGSANCGWVTLGEGTLLIDLPRGVKLAAYLDEVKRISGKPARKLAITSFQDGDEKTIAALVAQGIDEIATSPTIRDSLMAAWKGTAPIPIRTPSATQTIGDDTTTVRLLPADDVAIRGAAAIHVPQLGVLFGGPLIVNGPRTPLVGTDTENWLSTLKALQALRPTRVVPGRGSWGGSEIVDRQQRFLAELRRQVAYSIAQGHPKSSLIDDVHLPAGDLVWMPYDTPSLDDLHQVYREMTVPWAPFRGNPPQKDDSRPHALVLVGDQPHEPGHIIDELTPVFEATGVTPHFTVDVESLTAENLAKVRLLVILRDGLQRPTDDSSTHFVWMTLQQEEAVVRFVTGGGAFLNLHNAMGLYPDNGPYLKLVGGRYIGHGPLERFQVEVVDPNHPITRGVKDFWTADEQHTPPFDAKKVHLLLRNRSDDGKTVAAAGWAYEPGKGRLCHLAPGHTRESLRHPMYQRLMQNAVNWCLRRDVK